MRLTSFLLLLLIAMQVTGEVNWTMAHFVFAGALVDGVGLTYELAARMTRNAAYRAAAGVALAAAFILVWVNGRRRRSSRRMRLRWANSISTFFRRLELSA